MRKKLSIKKYKKVFLSIHSFVPFLYTFKQKNAQHMFGIPFGIIKHPTCYPVYHTV